MKKSDYKYFRDICHESDKHIEQIKEVLRIIKIEGSFIENGKRVLRRISKGKARELLGDKNYLSAIDRCAFHGTSCMWIDSDKTEILFDASKYLWKRSYKT